MTAVVPFEVWLTNRVHDPIMFAFVTGLLISTWIVPDVWGVVKRRFFGDVWHDTDIKDAIDYIVNDSRVQLKQPPPPHLSTEGHDAGKRITYVGVEHSDALQKLFERVASGEVSVWGFRQLPNSSQSYESSRRLNPVKFWGENRLDPLMCFAVSEQYRQTSAIGTVGLVEQYTGLRLCLAQVQKWFPKKPWYDRLWLIVNRTPRVIYR